MSRKARPLYNYDQIDKAGRVFISQNAYPKQRKDALTIIDNFRASHNFPLNTFQTWLRRNAKVVEPETSIVVQRIKRLYSIRLKLERMHGFRLSRMQDIGGCRAIVKTVESVYRLYGKYLKSSSRHKFRWKKDYIEQPKASGYRGIHLIYEYVSERNDTYNGQLLEIQLRTSLQHAWATAVEAVDIYTRQMLKVGKGETEWANFFKIMGTVIALREKKAVIPNTPTTLEEIKKSLLKYTDQIIKIKSLQRFGDALKSYSKDMADAKYILLMLESSQNSITVMGFKEDQEKEAMEYYSKMEQNELIDSVLVSIDDIEQLEKAYPNYFLDIQVFIGIVDEVIA